MRRGRIDWVKVAIITVIVMLCVIYVIGKAALVVNANTKDPLNEPVKLRATCYCDDGVTASGKQTRPGIMAAKPEWIGCVACVNAVNEDDSIGEFIGYFEILDTGYGSETGVGESKILKGKTLGTIETGQTVDIYMPTTHQAEEWIDTYGDYLYVKIIKGEG